MRYLRGLLLRALKDTLGTIVFLVTAYIVIRLTGCAPVPITPEPGPEPVDAAPDACGEACAKLAELGCPEAEPTPDGGMCIAVCLNVEQSGYATLDPACIARATSCDAVGACVWSAQ